MNEKTTGTAETAPALPCKSYLTHGGEAPLGFPGLSAREHAAIQLRVPNSGNEWLDVMIEHARRIDMATAFAVALIGVRGECHNVSAEAGERAEDLLDEVLFDESLEEPGYVHHMGAPDEDERPPTDAEAGRGPDDSVGREPQVGDIVVITKSNSSYFQVGTRARITQAKGGYWACFRDLGNTVGSWNDSLDGVWCIGHNLPGSSYAFELEPTHV